MLDKKLKDYIEVQFNCPENEIYHYTNQRNYSEILRFEFLRLNSHLFLNKKDQNNKEIKIGIDLIKSRLNEHPTLKREIHRFEKFIQKGIIYYTCSFSNNRSQKLSQKHGNYCIAFNSNLLKKFTEKSQSPTLFSNVEYKKEKQKEIISRIFKIFEENSKNNPDDITILFKYLAIIIPLLKHEDSSYDAECRFIQAEIFDPTGRLCTPIQSQKIEFVKEKHITNVYREEGTHTPLLPSCVASIFKTIFPR